MPSKAKPETTQNKRTFRKGAGLLLMISGIGMLTFLGIVLWINWPKARLQPEPLNAELEQLISRIPGKSDALIYVGLKDIRESRLWMEIIPDSLKKTPLFQPKGELETILKAAKINPTEDIDTLLISFRRRGYKEQHFMAVAWGPFTKKLPESFLKTNSTISEKIGGKQCYAMDSTLWLCKLDPNRLALTNSRNMMQEFLVPTGSFYQRDSLTTALINKAIYKSHLWFALPSASWTSGALQSLTSANRDMKNLGNLNRIRSMALSVRLKDGIEGQSEWVYTTRRAAYFSSTFLWGTIKLSELSSTRTSEQAKKLLEKLEIQQNFESVIIHTNLPIELFQQSKVKK
ncbi:MAG: hypothetical protein HGB23_04035 [Chlorobiaceae bacterium]|nr:hypothetical protein [Chlorobiaceae bacterium]